METIITGKILEEEQERIRNTQNTELNNIEDYLCKYKEYYKFNIYKDKTNDEISSTTFENYNTPKNYEINFDAQEQKIIINKYEKYVKIFISYNIFKDCTNEFLKEQTDTHFNLMIMCRY